MSGCWLWSGWVNKKGYGRSWSSAHRKAVMVHRLTWAKVNGELPVGMVLDHSCRVRSCVNPDHLRLVTNRENVLFNSVGWTAQNHAKQYCPRCGSTFSYRQDGHRVCKPCRSRVDHARYLRIKEASGV